MRASVLIITNEVALQRAVRACLGAGPPMEIDAMLWNETVAADYKGRLREADLVVAELFRRYPHGRRAEAVVLAERCVDMPAVLAIAPAYDAADIGCPGYWDVAAPDTLRERVDALIAHPERAMENFSRLKASVAGWLAVPKQH